MGQAKIPRLAKSKGHFKIFIQMELYDIIKVIIKCVIKVVFKDVFKGVVKVCCKGRILVSEKSEKSEKVSDV